MYLLYFPLIVLVLTMLAVLSRRSNGLRRELDELRRRLEALERDTNVPAAGHARAEAADVARVRVEDVPPIAPVPAVAPDPPRASAPPDAAIAPAASRGELEQWVGAVGLQNVGAVLLLVGFFFLVFWGYTTGRFGPGVLVGAGVLAGLGVAWRGARLRKSVRGLGATLIGVGAGVVWLSVYLGDALLHAFPAWSALPLLFAASAFTAALGLRYNVQGIAALGVLGAFLPHVLQVLVPLPFATQGPVALLAYLVPVNALVFALAARSGWSALALASLLLTAATWVASVGADHWGWPLEIALSALFVALGVAPLPRLVRVEGAVRPIDLAVIAVAPLALLVASWPMFELARTVHVALLLATLAAIYLGLALWVDQRRPERDLWRPLTAAATLFLAVSLERAVGPENTGLAWTLEGVALLVLGAFPRSGWLRTCGSAVAAVGAVRLLISMLLALGGPHEMPFVHAQAVRDAIAIAAMLLGTARLRRVMRSSGERWLAHGWLAASHALLAIWVGREMDHLSWALEGGSGIWRALPDVRAVGGVRYGELRLASVGCAWMAQAAWLARSGARAPSGFARGLASSIGFVAVLVLGFGFIGMDGWGRDRLPILDRTSLVVLGAIALATVVSLVLARRRSALFPAERRAPEAWAVAASILMLFWISRSADHLARVVIDVPSTYVGAWDNVPADLRDRVRSLAAIFSTVGWLAQAIAVFALGWLRRSPFLRWMALALLGVTLLKFVLVDLAHADPFWRFLTALVAGAAMLALSFVYQRRGGPARARKAEMTSATEPGPAERR